MPLLDGGVTVRVKPGTQPGSKYRVKGKGVPQAGPGDLIAVVDVPSHALTDAEREAIEHLRQVTQGGPEG